MELERQKATEDVRLRARYAIPGEQTRTIGEPCGPADGATLLQGAINRVRVAGSGEAWVEVRRDPQGSGTWALLVGVHLRQREEALIDAIRLLPGAPSCGSATSLPEPTACWPVDLSPLAARIWAQAVEAVPERQPV